MKRTIIILALLFSCFFTYSQEVILSDSVKQFYKLCKVITEITTNPKNYTDEQIDKAFGNLFKTKLVPGHPYNDCYLGYADILAKRGDYNKAIAYYDTAYYAKKLTPANFALRWRKELFNKDTVLYFQKLQEYQDNFGKIYSYRELQIMNKLNAMLQIDQFARNYDDHYPNRNMLFYVDSLNMDNIVSLIKENPDIEDPLDYDFLANFILGRHLYSAYPEFWLQYIEPITMKKLAEGRGNPQAIARTYDRCIIYAKGEKSYYGEFDDNGDAINPDTNAVNRHRTNIGLPPLDQKENKSNVIYTTY